MSVEVSANEPPVCAKCGDEYSLRDGCEVTAYCDSCAQEVVQELALKLDLANMELATIDEVLARRPALAELKHRTEKIERACSVNGELLAALVRICAEAESWHKETGHEDDKPIIHCDSICACIPQMRAAIRKAKGEAA